MKFWVAVTNDQWFHQLKALEPPPDEVNFWTPGTSYPKLAVGTPFLFKLHAPNNFVVGGGFFVYYTVMPLAIAWDSFEAKNGVTDIADFQQRLSRIKKAPVAPDTAIGCVVLSEPFFFERDRWIPIPENWHPNVERGMYYDTSDALGEGLWRTIEMLQPKPVLALAEQRPAFSEPQLVRRRLGQGYFQFVVRDAYQWRCAVTGEKARPALEAAHIVPFAQTLTHDVRNGLLLRADIHRLFDRGYVTVAPDHRFLVSKSIRDDFHNGEEYYRFHGNAIALPEQPSARPDQAFLERHASTVFRG